MAPQEIAILKDVWTEYDGVTALEGVTLSLHEHDFLGIIGPNGGGKTTLIKVMLGLVKPIRGEVRILGDAPEKQRKSIGYIPQYSPFDRDFPVSVWDVALMGRLGRAGRFRKYSDADKEVTLGALEIVGMADLRDSQMGKLSGGQQQRVFLARALVTEPKLLLLDEPMASVDVSLQTGLYELLEKLTEKMSIVMVSHDIGAISVHVNKIACLNRKLFYHNSKEIRAEELEATYKCPVQLIAHGVPHRVLKKHK
jgi:zinc transport system ATP-binding protein